jgi:hypothetical protein
MRVHSNGWQNVAWLVPAFLALSFALLAMMPLREPQRFQDYIRDPRGLLALVAIVAAFVALVLRFYED